MTATKLKKLPKLLAPEAYVLELVPFIAVSGAVEYNDTSEALFNTPNGALICGIGVIVDTAFNGSPVLKIGDGSTTDKYMTVSDSLKVAGSSFQWIMKETATGLTITATLSQGVVAATAGSCRVFVMYKPTVSQRYLVR